MNIPTSSFPSDTDQTGILLIRSLDTSLGIGD